MKFAVISRQHDFTHVFPCRDPRSRMLMEQQEKKLSAGKPPDGAKLSFKEKMKLFAQEVSQFIFFVFQFRKYAFFRLEKILPGTKQRFLKHREKLTIKTKFPFGVASALFSELFLFRI